MAVIFALVVLFAGIIYLEVPGMMKKQQWRELAAFGFLMTLAMVLSFAMALDIPMPNPIKLIEAVFTPVTDFIDGLLT